MRTFHQLSKSPTTGLLVLSVLTWGCENRTGQSTTPGNQSSKPAQDIRPAQPDREKDQSLKSEEYVRMGLPAPDKVWSGADMMKANQVLASFTPGKAAQLPRYKSSRSGDVFARLTSVESLPSFRDRAVPVQTRLQQAGDYGHGL
jgi:hypothetical protein